MTAKRVNIGLYFGGEFRRTGYSGGDYAVINRVEADTFAYNDLMEEVKDLLKLTEIGGVYVKEGKNGGWKRVKNDLDVIEEVEKCEDGFEAKFYVDIIVDTEAEPVVELQPHVIVRPRKNLFQVKKVQKRKYVTTHDLQQKQKQKMTKPTPEVGQRYKLRSSPALLSIPQDGPRYKLRSSPIPQDASPEHVKDRGSAKRKLHLTRDIPESELPPPPPLTDYERERIAQMQQNNKRLEELGVQKLVVDLRAQSSGDQTSKQKEKVQEECDDYIPEIEDEDDSEDASERIKKVKKKKLQVGPQTRSRANVTAPIENEVAPAGTTTVNKVTNSFSSNLLRPTCSKLLKSASNPEACGSVVNYLALRERQKQGIPPPTPNNVQESNLENIVEEETEKAHPRKYRGRTKMVDVHKRTPDERPVIFLNKRGAPVSKNRKITRELSNFLGTLAKDEVSLTYINWRVVPETLKKRMWDYTRERYLIPDGAQNWVFSTINRSWRTYKSRMKSKYYSQYETDEERMNNRPNDIPLEDFKMLVKYWGDESVQELANDNKEHRTSLTDPHTLGANSSAQVGEKLKTIDPNLASPSNADIYLESREREDGRTYKTRVAVQKRNSKKKKMESDSATADPDPYLDDLTAKIRGELEAELEEKVNMKVKDNLSMVLKKLAEANPGLNLDIGDFCATLSSEDDENGTPFTAGTTGTARTAGTSS